MYELHHPARPGSKRKPGIGSSRLGRALAVLLAGSPAFALAAAGPMADLLREYEADTSAVLSFHDMPWSDARFARLERLAADWRTRLDAVHFDALDAPGRVDHILLRTAIEDAQAGVARNRKRLADIEALIAFRGTITDLEQARWRGAPVDVRDAAAKIATVTAQAKELRERVEKGVKKDAAATNPPPALAVTPTIALRAAGAVAELKGALKRWYEFYNGYQPEFTWWLKAPCEEADKQLDEYAKYLREEVAGQKGKPEDPLVGDPAGAEALAEAIRLEFLPHTADELIAIGERELARGERELKAAAKAMGFGDDWQAALAKVKTDFVAPGEQDALVAGIARDATDFVRAKSFVTVPALCGESWRMSMISPEGLKTVPYAAYSGRDMMVAYPREEMKLDDKLMVMRGNNRHFTRLTTPHELIPGHHLQRFVGARSHTYRLPFSTPFYVEGWAFYCELRLWELGWPRTPEERFGMLFWRMNRGARIVTTLKYHLGRMKPDEMVAFLVDRVGHEKFGATSEVRRSIGDGFPPLYQASYMIGGLQLDALRAELTKTGGLSEQQFNDAVLTANSLPIELLRAELKKTALPRDARPSWRFEAERGAR